MPTCDETTGNIGSREIMIRNLYGYILLIPSIILAGILILGYLVWSVYLSLALFVPIFLGMTGVLQARNRTCVWYAGKGQFHMNGKNTEIDSPEVVVHYQKISRSILFQSLAFAVIVVLLIII